MEYVPLKAKRAVHMNCILVDKVISYGHMGLTTILNPFYMYTEIKEIEGGGRSKVSQCWSGRL